MRGNYATPNSLCTNISIQPMLISVQLMVAIGHLSNTLYPIIPKVFDN